MNRMLYSAREAGKEIVDIRGYFTTDGSGNVLAQVPKGTLANQGFFTVTKVGTGLFNITFDAVYDIIEVSAELWGAAGNFGNYVQPTTASTPNNGASPPRAVVQLQFKSNGGTATDLNNQKCTFAIGAKNSQVSP